jgi:hypothetical protein
MAVNITKLRAQLDKTMVETVDRAAAAQTGLDFQVQVQVQVDRVLQDKVMMVVQEVEVPSGQPAVAAVPAPQDHQIPPHPKVGRAV